MIWGWAEKSWDAAKSWQELWDQLRRCEKSWEELRRCEKRREEMRRQKTWDELRRAEKSWENVRRTGKIWEALTGEDWWRAEKSWIETSCVERSSWQELRRYEKRSDDMRRDEKVVISGDKLRKGEKTWDEMRWDGMMQAAATMGCNEQSPREAAMRWDHMKWKKMKRSNFEKSRVCCCEAQKACPHPISTFCVPLYSYRRFSFETSAHTFVRALFVNHRSTDFFWVVVIPNFDPTWLNGHVGNFGGAQPDVHNKHEPKIRAISAMAMLWFHL